MSKKIILAAESFAAKNSGIGRVARLMALSLDGQHKDVDSRIKFLSLSDEGNYILRPKHIDSCRGNRFAFVSKMHIASLHSEVILYDSLSMARAHAMGPAVFKKSLAWMHGIEVWEGARPEHIKAAERATLLITNSEYTRSRASRLYRRLDRSEVCWLGTETDVAPFATPTPTTPTALILSRIDQDSYKGHFELIAAWPKVVAMVPNARLLIAGSGPGLEEIKQAVSRSSVARNIELLGFVPESELTQLWNRSTVFSMPSRGEGFGLTYIEAMRHGIPVVASTHDAGKEINLDGVTGYNVNLDIPGNLSDVLIALLKNSEKSRAMGQAGRIRWEQNFAFRHFKKRFLSILDKCNFLDDSWIDD